MRDHFIPEAVLFIQDGKISGFGEMRSTPVPNGCQIIDAQGAYVGPYMQRLIRRIKGDSKIILITDQTAHKMPNPPGYAYITDLNFTLTEDGGIDISGSRLTLNVACRNYMKHTGASLVDAFRTASYNPARALGMDDRGEIAVGKRADLVLVDDKVNVKTVLLAGEVQ